MKWITNLLLRGFSFGFRALLYQQAARRLRIKGVLTYLKALQILRKAFAGSILFYLFLQVFIVGFVGSLVVGVLLLPQDLNTKLWILLSIFGTFFIVPLVFLLFIFSEKVWYQMSGAEQMLLKND